MLKKSGLIAFLFLFVLSACSYAVDAETVKIAEKYLVKKTSETNKQKALSPSLSETENADEGAQNEKDKTKDSLGKEKATKLSKFEEMVSESVTSEGFSAVELFGYSIFDKKNKKLNSFVMPEEDVAVNSDYIVGPGDSFKVTIWGISEGIFEVKVNQNGEIILPKVGVVNVAGLTYSQLKPYVESQLNKFYEGINVGITFNQLRTVRVYVVGEVNQPGSYSLSSLSTAYNALFYAGGPTKQGTLRNIKVIRNGRTVATVDLYKFLLKGDSSQDRQLQSGDTVFVPLIGEQVAVVGNVNRPAIYEIKGRADLMDVLWLAGDVNPASYLNHIQIERLVAHQQKIIMDEDVSFLEKRNSFGIPILDMDIIKISPVYSEVKNKILLKGSVKYPGSYEYKPGMRLLDVLKKDMLKDLYSPRVELVRTLEDGELKTTIYNLSYEDLFVKNNPSYNVELMPLDEIYVFTAEKKEEVVELKGEFKRPGKYALLKGERISSVLRRAGGYTGYAYLFGAVLTRKSVKDIQKENYGNLIQKLELDLLRRERELNSGYLAQEDINSRSKMYERTRNILDFLKTTTMKGRVIIRLDEIDKLASSSEDIEMEDGDELFVPKTPKSVVVLGEVYTPTAVAYNSYSRVKDYLRRVGGPTPNADNGGIYIARADGSVVSQRQERDVLAMGLYPGDSVLVPEKLESITFWGVLKEATHWFYEAAVSLAVISNVIK